MSATIGVNQQRLALSCNSEQDDLKTSSSILDFLNQERNCLTTDQDCSELDIDSIFEEINRLSERIDETRSVDEILQEAETLLLNQAPIQLKCIDLQLCDYENVDHRPHPSLMSSAAVSSRKVQEKFQHLAMSSDQQKHLSQESTPREMCASVSHSKSESQIAKKPVNSIDRSRSRNGDRDYPSSLRNTPDSGKLVHSQTMMSPPPMGMSPALTLDDIQMHQQPLSMSSSIYSPTNSYARERALESEITSLQEKLKDTEERYHSLRIQYDTLSVQHRDLREQQSAVQDETEKLRRDVKHLNDCAAILRNELQIAREDRQEACRLQKILQGELNESRSDRKKYAGQTDRDSKTIMDLQRQCKEMERILMRKHPDSVSALIVAAKGTNYSNGRDDGAASRKLLEQRIMQLEQDAKEQDSKAQRILSNVQTKFSAIQAKYETHIADLETQVLSLQDINTQLNSKIVQLTETVQQQRDKERELLEKTVQSTKPVENMTNRSTQTVTTGKATNLPRASSANKSQASAPDHDSTHLMATIRGMRVDLAIKEKALQRLTRELDECKKTIRKLKEMSSKIQVGSTSGGGGGTKKPYDPLQFTEKVAESVALKEAHHKLKLLEFDYKALHDKRLQDLKTLQAAHERELASCQETVRILQQRLAEGDEAQKQRRRVPVDYYALKAKVTCLEQRHSEREDRLHMLVEALSKGRLNGIIDETFLKGTAAARKDVDDNGSGSEPSVSPNSE